MAYHEALLETTKLERHRLALTVTCPICYAGIERRCNLMFMDSETGYHKARYSKATLDLSRGRYIVTGSGNRIYLDSPEPSLINFDDIGKGLAKLCRFHGQTREFFSVAQHCIFMSYLVDEKDWRTAFFHDASEAYLGDLPQPLKRLLPGYEVIEDQFMRVIAEAMKFPYPMSEDLKNIDRALGMWEARKYHCPEFYDPFMDRQIVIAEEKIPRDIRIAMPPEIAYHNFVLRCKVLLCGERIRAERLRAEQNDDPY